MVPLGEKSGSAMEQRILLWLQGAALEGPAGAGVTSFSQHHVDRGAAWHGCSLHNQIIQVIGALVLQKITGERCFQPRVGANAYFLWLPVQRPFSSLMKLDWSGAIR